MTKLRSSDVRSIHKNSTTSAATGTTYIVDTD
jgi:hypothetical protein